MALTISVYWIRKKSHNDKTTEGYIGVSSNPERRWKEHKRDVRGGYHCNSYLSNAIKKYENELIYEIIFTGTEEECYNYELALRPEPSIGWNMMSGGPVGKITEEGRKRLSEAGKKRGPLSISAKLKAFNTRNGTNLNIKEYKDYLAEKNGEIPPSKLKLQIFDMLNVVEYKNAEEAANNSKFTVLEILDICDTDNGDWIYLKNL